MRNIIIAVDDKSPFPYVRTLLVTTPIELLAIKTAGKNSMSKLGYVNVKNDSICENMMIYYLSRFKDLFNKYIDDKNTIDNIKEFYAYAMKDYSNMNLRTTINQIEHYIKDTDVSDEMGDYSSTNILEQMYQI